MSYEETKAGSDDVYFGIEWNESSNAATFSIAPTIYRWDVASTDNYGSTFSEALSPDPTGSGSWSGLTYPSGSGYRTIDTFGTRTYSRGHSDSTVTYTIYTDSEFGTWNGYWQSIGSLSRSFSITVPRKASYTVSYNANGGSGAPSAQTKWYGETLTLSSTKPTRTGYTFKGWATSASGSVAYASGANYTANAAATLYAVWQANTYTVSYSGNGATSGSTAAQTKTYGVNLTLRANGFARTGYTFYKWNTKADKSGTYYSASATYTANAAATLYAIWTAITYSVKYNANGGSGSMSNSTHTYNDAKNLTSEGFTRAYVVTFNYNGSGASNTTSTATYTFKNWNTAANGSGTSYANGASVKNLSATQGATVNLYAQWTSASVTLPTPTWTGHTFAGWYTASSGGTKIGNGGASYTPTAAITLYAHWTTNTYTVAYNANGGSGAPASQTKTYGVNLTLSSTKPTRSQYNFTAWNTKADGSGTPYQPGATYTANSAATLYAQWAVTHVAPTITSVSAIRCDASGNADDEGTRCKVTVKWSVYSSDGSKGKSIAVTIGGTTDTKTDSAITSVSTGTYSFVHSKTNLDIASSYAVAVVLTDSKNYTASKSAVLSPAFFTMDFFAGGHGVAIGKPATTADLLDVGMPMHISNPITIGTNTTAEENGIRIKGGGTRNAWLLRNISAANGDGDAVLLGNGGMTIVGAGESAPQLWNTLTSTNPVPPEGTKTAGSEQMYIGSDNDITFYTNCQTVANRVGIILSTVGSLYRKHYTLDSSSANNGGISESVAAPGYGLVDKNGKWVGYANTWGDTAGGSYYSIRSRRYINAANVDNALTLGVDKDGNRTVGVSASAPWRTALIVPGLGTANVFDGGTQKQEFSGNKNWSEKDTAADITKANNGFTSGTRYHEWLSYDKNDAIPGGVSNLIASGGNVQTQLRCRNVKSSDGTTVVNNNIVLTVGKDGTQTVSVTAPAAWRSALGLGTSGAFPITVAQGGTGLTSAPSMLTNLASTTAASPLAASPRPGITGTLAVAHGGTGMTQDYTNTIATGVVFRAWGHSAYLRVEVTKNFTEGYSAFTLGTVPSGYRPAAEVVVPATVYDTGRCCCIVVGTDGVIKASQLGGSALGNHKLVGTASWVI